MKATCGMLTYKGHLDKDEYRSWFEDEFGYDKMKMGIAHESGDSENGYDHTHVVVHFGKSVTISKKRLASGFNFNNVHPHWKIMSGRNAWKDGIKYITKEDVDVGVDIEEVLGFEGVLDRIWDCKDEREVLKMCNDERSVIPYLNAYKYKFEAERHVEYAEGIRNLELNEWQRYWWSILKEQNDREILWIYDKVGGKGKSTFGKWLRARHGAERVVLRSKAVNFMFKGSEYAYVNLTRTQEEYIGYQALEELKDGDLISDKYEGRSNMYAPPKVIVFANFRPNVNSMTIDRWRIINCKRELPSVALPSVASAVVPLAMD